MIYGKIPTHIDVAGSWLIGSALVGFGVRQHVRAQLISKRFCFSIAAAVIELTAPRRHAASDDGVRFRVRNQFGHA